MLAKFKQFLFLFVAVGLALIFVVLTFQKIDDFSEIVTAFKNANHWWIFASMALSIYSYWLRAIRWNLLLEPLHHKINNSNGFWSIAMGYFMNLTIPRSGEIARATSLYKTENVPVDESLGTIVVERVVDLLFLGLFFLLTLLFNFDTLSSFWHIGLSQKSSDSSSSYSWLKYAFIGAIVLGILCVAFLYFIKPQVFNAIKEKAFSFIRGIMNGILAIAKMKERGKFVLYSFGIWICYFLMTYLVLLAFEETKDLGVSVGFFLIVSGTLGMILPVSGGLGYPYIMSIAFSALYFARGESMADGTRIGNYFGLISYACQLVSMLIFGILSFWFIGKNAKNNSFKDSLSND